MEKKDTRTLLKSPENLASPWFGCEYIDGSHFKIPTLRILGVSKPRCRLPWRVTPLPQGTRQENSPFTGWLVHIFILHSSKQIFITSVSVLTLSGSLRSEGLPTTLARTSAQREGSSKLGKIGLQEESPLTPPSNCFPRNFFLGNTSAIKTRIFPPLLPTSQHICYLSNLRIKRTWFQESFSRFQFPFKKRDEGHVISWRCHAERLLFDTSPSRTAKHHSYFVGRNNQGLHTCHMSKSGILRVSIQWNLLTALQSVCGAALCWLKGRRALATSGRKRVLVSLLSSDHRVSEAALSSTAVTSHL